MFPIFVCWAFSLIFALLSPRQSVVIAPLRFGAGVKIKILESMALGKAVVTTSIGAEGIEAQPGRTSLLPTTLNLWLQKLSAY